MDARQKHLAVRVSTVAPAGIQQGEERGLLAPARLYIAGDDSRDEALNHEVSRLADGRSNGQTRTRRVENETGLIVFDSVERMSREKRSMENDRCNAQATVRIADDRKKGWIKGGEYIEKR